VERARDNALQAEHAVVVAEQRLLALLGLSHSETNVSFGSPESPLRLDSSLAELEPLARASRPDVRASELALEAAGLRAGLARADLFALAAVVDANGSGKEGFEIGPGLQLPIPVFNQNQAGRARAAAELERAAWNSLATRQRVTLEVREAHAKYRQAAEALQHWSTRLVPSLEELVRRSEKAFELGELSPLAVQENARQLLEARVRQAELTAELRRARAELERSVGTRLPHASGE
jgi:cobalt-zinc-cadmium efflux system outer membrane protein